MRKINLLKLPTPLEEIRIDNKNRYFIKRDDLTDFALGGNKARKIEFFLSDIKEKGCNYVVTYGSVQSNHCRITAVAAARLGLSCLLILSGTEKDISFSGNDIIYNLAGASIRFCEVNEVSKTIEKEMNNLRSKGFNPYFIQGGGHGNLGTHAYVEAYKEIKQQSEELNISFDYIFLASGTGTTQAGLIAGKTILGGKEKIVGISVARRAARGINVIKDSLKSYFVEFYNENLIEDEEIIFDDSYVGKGYGDIYKEVVDSIKFMLTNNSIILDPVYTGKAFYGMCNYIKKEDIKGKNILFIHTGGVPCLFACGKKIIHGKSG